MFGAIVFAWLHYLSVMFLSGALVAEIYLLKLGPSRDTLDSIARVDRIYGASAAAVLLTGLGRLPLVHGGKGLDYYLHNGAFHGAVTLFLIAGAISIVPTLRFLRWKKAATANGALPSADAWRGLRKLVHLQLTALALIALLMPMIARGVAAF